MSEVKKGIRELIKQSGGKAKAKSDAQDWFETSKKSIREGAVQNTATRMQPGKVYVFRYDVTTICAPYTFDNIIFF